MSRPIFATLLCAFLLSSSSCMVSEQIGQDREDLTFHFDTQFNRVVLFARSGALAALALWLLAQARRRALAPPSSASCCSLQQRGSS